MWLAMMISGNRNGQLFGLIFETYMFLSILAAVLGSLLIRIGI